MGRGASFIGRITLAVPLPFVSDRLTGTGGSLTGKAGIVAGVADFFRGGMRNSFFKSAVRDAISSRRRVGISQTTHLCRIQTKKVGELNLALLAAKYTAMRRPQVSLKDQIRQESNWTAFRPDPRRLRPHLFTRVNNWVKPLAGFHGKQALFAQCLQRPHFHPNFTPPRRPKNPDGGLFLPF